jgi:hypothetical protein
VEPFCIKLYCHDSLTILKLCGEYCTVRTYTHVNPFRKILYCQDTHRMSNHCAEHCTCIANQLRDVNTICRRSWYIAAHVWKIYDFKIEVVPLIINFSTELTTVVKLRRVNVETISRANVDTMSKMTTGQRWHSIQLRPHHFWTYTSNLTTVVNSVLKFSVVLSLFNTYWITVHCRHFTPKMRTILMSFVLLNLFRRLLLLLLIYKR